VKWFVHRSNETDGGSCTNVSHTFCCTPGNHVRLENAECEHMIGRGRCKGTIQSALSEKDSRECSSFGGSGHEGSVACAQCDGYGWLFVQMKRRAAAGTGDHRH
jgi:hypothetical protein